MARTADDTMSRFSSVMKDIESGKFAPVYVLYGDEPYFTDEIVSALLRNVLSDTERDFNQTLVYGNDVTAVQVMDIARSYPVFSERRLVVVRESQLMKNLEDMKYYFEKPLESTVLALAFSGSGFDKRKAAYRLASSSGTVLESSVLKDYQVRDWILSSLSAKRLTADREAVEMLCEFCGTDLRRMNMELTKLSSALPEGQTKVTSALVEANTGISREYNVFELTKAMSRGDLMAASKVAARLGADRKTPLVVVMGVLASHFMKLLKCAAAESAGRIPDQVLAKTIGVYPSFLAEYRQAVRMYGVGRIMGAISLLKEYDRKSKTGGHGDASDSEILTELVVRLMS